jgi:diketogulonate reductase-like aldo/keto reductase
MQETVPTITLNNGVRMPQLGLGVLQMNEREVRDVVPVALDAGYRLIDTASRYYNEQAVGQAIAESGIPQDELFVTTKLWFKDHGYEQTSRAFRTSLDKLKLDYLDLWLIHQPFGNYYGSWKAMEDLYADGLVRAIGVSNFYDDRYLDLVTHNEVVPAVNQREVHPYSQQARTHKFMKEHGTTLQAWSPLAQGSARLLDDPVLTAIGEQHGKTVSQVILRWLLQSDIAFVVKSAREGHLRENIDILDFSLTGEDMAQISALDRQEAGAMYDLRDPQLFKMLLTLR